MHICAPWAVESSESLPKHFQTQYLFLSNLLLHFRPASHPHADPSRLQTLPLHVSRRHARVSRVSPAVGRRRLTRSPEDDPVAEVERYGSTKVDFMAPRYGTPSESWHPKPRTHTGRLTMCGDVYSFWVGKTWKHPGVPVLSFDPKHTYILAS